MRPAAAKICAWRESPVLFVRECLGVEPDAWQAEVLEAVRDHRRIALKASKGPGKSTVLSWIGWWYLSTRLHPKIVATSITGDNLRDNLWTELAKWQAKSPFLQAAFEWSAERIVAKDHPKTWWISARTWPKSADATQQSDALAGIHADAVLFLIDEAGGIPDAVVATAEAGLANVDEAAGREAKLVLAGNPTHLTGPLYRACTRERHLWWVKEISGDPDDPNRAPRVSREWAQEQIEKYGRDNPWVVVNVFGRFPPGQSNTLISADVAGQAARRTLGEAEFSFAPKVLGVDVARFGDDRTVFAPRQGRMALPLRVLRNLDAMEVAGQVLAAMAEFKPDAVFVDETGLGAGVVDRLRELGHREVIGVNASAKSPTARCLNLRAHMWAEMAEWLKGASLPDDPELLGELAGPTYWFRSDGKLQLEGKDELKARGMASPDKADALALTFAAPVAIRTALDRAIAARRSGPDAHDYDPFAERR